MSFDQLKSYERLQIIQEDKDFSMISFDAVVDYYGAPALSQKIDSAKTKKQLLATFLGLVEKLPKEIKNAVFQRGMVEFSIEKLDAFAAFQKKDIHDIGEKLKMHTGVENPETYALLCALIETEIDRLTIRLVKVKKIVQLDPMNTSFVGYIKTIIDLIDEFISMLDEHLVLYLSHKEVYFDTEIDKKIHYTFLMKNISEVYAWAREYIVEHPSLDQAFGYVETIDKTIYRLEHRLSNLE